jgi:hypothetical protein
MYVIHAITFFYQDIEKKYRSLKKIFISLPALNV